MNHTSTRPMHLPLSQGVDSLILMIEVVYGPRREKSSLQGFANKKGADQPAYTCRLISAFVILFLGSTISKLATSKILIF